MNPASEQQKDHTGTVCPICGINGVCGHPVKFPAVCAAAWVPNVWVKSIPTDN
jgi:hypothetical protein